MNGHRILTGLLIAAQVLAGFAFARMEFAGGGDANGDQRVDVLDIQAVIAAVLNGGAPTAGADVNGDKRVDILDYQLIVTRVNQAQPAPKRVPDTPESGVVARSPECCLLADMRIVRLVAPSADSRDAQGLRAFSAPPVPLSARAELYLHGLRPNAPPIAA